MPVTVVAIRERAPNERRVALSPEVAKKLRGLGASVLIEGGAGSGANLPDSSYPEVESVPDVATALGRADVLLKVQPPTLAEIAALREGAVLISYLQPHADSERTRALRDRKITSFAMELLPRTTRAQAMDVLSSQAGMAGYKAVLIAAQTSGKFFPMLTTAAGTIRPSKVLIVGAGVAGLQAIATARRLGAQVECFDVRPETREQIESLGAKFLDLGVSAAGSGGYARELTAEERAAQQQRLADHLKNIDVIVTTAAVPGRKAPRIITAAMVEGMKPGSVIVDLAAETGGNCELTRPGETFVHNSVTIVGPVNLPSMGAIHASEMYARNLFNFLALSLKDGALNLDWNDELIAQTCLTHAGEIRHQATRQMVDGERRNWDGFLALYIFMLAAFTGHEIISRVPVILHTPLMSGSNFVHGIVVVGGMVALAHADTNLERAIGFLAVLLGAGNAVGGYVVTERMLDMFKSSKPAAKSEGGK